jgi:repressor LexA
MTGAHIFDGDYVIVRESPVVENGEIGVAIVNDEATVKRIRRTKKGIRLEAENPEFKPMEFDAEKEDVRVAGKVVGVVRKL